MVQRSADVGRRLRGALIALAATIAVCACAESRDASPDDTIPRITAESTTTTATVPAAVGHVAGNGRADHRATGPTADAGDTAADAGAAADAGHDPADRPTDDALGWADLDARRQPR